MENEYEKYIPAIKVQMRKNKSRYFFEIINPDWICGGMMLSIPFENDELRNIQDKQEWQRPGFYILLNTDRTYADSGKYGAYIGQSNNLLRRLLDHIKDPSKQFANRALLFTTSNKHRFSRDDLYFFERYLITKAKQANIFEITNSNESFNTHCYIDTTTLHKYIHDTFIALDIIGLNFFVDMQFIVNAPKNDLKELDDKLEVESTILDKKSKVVDWLIKNNIQFNNEKIVYSNTNNKYKNRKYWSTIKPSIVEEGFILILNDNEKKELMIIQVPPNFFPMSSDKLKNHLKIRGEEKVVVDLYIDEDLIEINTSLNLNELNCKKVEY